MQRTHDEHGRFMDGDTRRHNADGDACVKVRRHSTFDIKFPFLVIEKVLLGSQHLN